MALYIFDDCSTDNTLGIVENLLRTYPIPQNMNVRIIKNNTNIGRQANYNKWFKFLKTCNTDFACILDGGGWWGLPAFIKKHLRYHKIHQTAPASFFDVLFVL